MPRSYKTLFALTVALFALPAGTAHAGQLTHTVQPGENLYRIGLKYGVSWLDIAQANGLLGELVYVGQELVIPEAGLNPVEPAQASEPGEEETAVSEEGDAGEVWHTVARGETLARIAEQYGVSWQAIIRANELRNPGLVYAGQVLLIPRARPPSSEGAGPGSAGSGVGASNHLIVVDISEQHMYVYEGETLVFSFVASTGLPGLDTARGTFHVQSKIENAYGSTWDIWMPHWLGIYWAGYLENGIHSLPILPGGGRLWEGYLGAPISYGCVVLGISEAEQLWNWAQLGDTVIVQP